MFESNIYIANPYRCQFSTSKEYVCSDKVMGWAYRVDSSSRFDWHSTHGGPNIMSSIQKMSRHSRKSKLIIQVDLGRSQGWKAQMIFQSKKKFPSERQTTCRENQLS